MKALIALVLIVGALGSGCFLHVSHYTAPDGSIVYVGDFYNDVPGPGFPTAMIEGKFYDAAGNLITTKNGFTCNGVSPKGVIPFKVTLPPGTAEPARVDWRIVDAPAEPYLATGLEANVTNTFTAGNTTYVVGELRNTSTNTYVSGWPCASWTDADGNVVRQADGIVAGQRLGPGDVRPFELWVDTPPAGSTIHLYLDAGVTNSPGSVGPSAIDVPASALQNGYGPTAPIDGTQLTLGVYEVHNPTAKPFIPAPVAEVRDASGNLLAVNFGGSQCDVYAAPGSFSYTTYVVRAPATVTTPPTVSLQGYEVNDTIYSPAVSSLTFSKSGDTVTATGTVKNTSTATLNHARVCVGAYDAGGTVRNVGMVHVTLPSSGLAPNGTASFSVSFTDPWPVTNVKAVADGWERK